MTRDINPITAFGHALQSFGVTAREAAEAMARMNEVMAQLVPSYYSLGKVPRLEITTARGEKITLADVSLDIEVETESLSHRTFGSPNSSELIVGVETKATLKIGPEDAEELYRLIRED